MFLFLNYLFDNKCASNILCFFDFHFQVPKMEKKRKSRAENLNNIQREYPHLTVQEEEFYKKHLERDLEQDVLKLEKQLQEIDKGEPYADKTYAWFHQDFMLIKHPVMKTYLSNMDHVSDPYDIMPGFSFLGKECQPARPKTNRDRYSEFSRLWLESEMDKTEEYKAFTILESKRYKIRNKLRIISSDLTKFKKIQSIVEKSIEKLSAAFLNTYMSLIHPEKEKEKSKRSRQEKVKQAKNNNDHRVKGLMIPIMHQEKWVKFFLTRNREKFSSDTFVLQDGMASSNNPAILGTITLNGEIVIRNDDYKQDLSDSLIQLGNDPKTYLSITGKKVNMCLICGKPLTNDQSLELGYGPVCARIFQFQ